MTITLCGGGSLGHVCIGMLSQHNDITVNLLTGHPEAWNHNITVTDKSGKIFRGHLDTISSKAKDVIPMADIIILCVPGYLIEENLKKIKPHLKAGTAVGSIVSSTGFFFFAHDILGGTSGITLFGFQRVPFIARIAEYGKSGNLLGYKDSIAIAIEGQEGIADNLRNTMESLFDTPTHLLSSFYEAALTNSNPILHTSRLYSMWHEWDGTTFPKCTLFYKEWTTEAAQLLIDMDNEFMNILDTLPMNKNAIPTILDYYESSDAESLATKLRSIEAFKTIASPMKEVKGGWVPDFSSRYFTEDFPFGLRFIVDLAHKNNVPTPLLDKVYEWGCSVV